MALLKKLHEMKMIFWLKERLLEAAWFWMAIIAMFVCLLVLGAAIWGVVHLVESALGVQ